MSERQSKIAAGANNVRRFVVSPFARVNYTLKLHGPSEWLPHSYPPWLSSKYGTQKILVQ